MTHKYLTSSSLLVLTLSLTTHLSAMIVPEADAGLSSHAALAPAENIIVNGDAVPAAPVAAPVVVAPLAAPVEAAQAAPAVMPPQAEAAPKAKSWWPFGLGSSSSSSSTTAPKEDVKAVMAEGAKAIRAQHEDSIEDKFADQGGADLLTASFIREPKFEAQVKALMAAKDQQETLKAVDALKEKALGHHATKKEKQLAALEIQAMTQTKAQQQGWSFFGWLFGTSKKADLATVAASADKPAVDAKAGTVEMASVAPVQGPAPVDAAPVAPTAEAAPAAEVLIAPTTPVTETPALPNVPTDAPTTEAAMATVEAPVATAEAPAPAESSAAADVKAAPPAEAAPAVATKTSQSWFSWFFGGTSKKGDALAEVVANLKDNASKTGVEVVDTATASSTATTPTAETASPAADMATVAPAAATDSAATPAAATDTAALGASLLKARADVNAGTMSDAEFADLKKSVLAQIAAKSAPMQIDGRLALEPAAASTSNATTKAAQPLVDIEDLATDPVDGNAAQHASDYTAFGELFAEVPEAPNSVDTINEALEQARLEAEAQKRAALTRAALELVRMQEEERQTKQNKSWAEVAKLMKDKPVQPMFSVNLGDPDMSKIVAAAATPQAQSTDPRSVVVLREYNNDDDNGSDGELDGAGSMVDSTLSPLEDIVATVEGFGMTADEYAAYLEFNPEKLSGNVKKQMNRTIRENITGGVHLKEWVPANRYYYLSHPNKGSFGALAIGVVAPTKLKRN